MDNCYMCIEDREYCDKCLPLAHEYYHGSATYDAYVICEHEQLSEKTTTIESVNSSCEK